MTESAKKLKKAERRDSRRRRRKIIYYSAVIAAFVIGAAAIFYYTSFIAPFRKTVLTVDNRPTSMDYFLKRTRMAGGDATLTLQQLAYEQVIEITAQGYNISAGGADVDSELRKNAAAEGVRDEAGFGEWYLARLERTRLSDDEYREMVAAGIMGSRMLEYLAQNISTSAEQIHLYAITVATSAEAENVRTRLAAGENFTALAGSLSKDTQTKSKGGEVGWIPRGVTPYDDVVFGLNPGEISAPVAVDPANPATSQYTVFQVTEKETDRKIDPGPLLTLRSRTLYDFLLQQFPKYVKFSYSPADTAWVTKQLAKTP